MLQSTNDIRRFICSSPTLWIVQNRCLKTSRSGLFGLDIFEAQDWSSLVKATVQR